MINYTDVPLIEYIHVFWDAEKQGCSHETWSYENVISQSEILSSLLTPVNDVPHETDEADILLKTNETDISFEMMIIELRLDLIHEGYVGSSFSSSVTIFLLPISLRYSIISFPRFNIQSLQNT